MKTYIGRRTEEGSTVTVNGQPLNPRFEIRNHSPDGFEWGYGGLGPAQLALALLMDCCHDLAFAQQEYQNFKRKVIGRLEEDTFTMTDQEILAWCALQPKRAS